MSFWGILVKYKDGEININEGYKTYNEAKKAILKKINIEETKIISDYIFIDLENEITYELKTIVIH